jgi:sterol desaturase/sphingolipid hydroxylase (fatty acid hydroxylase superfamily)
MELFFIHFILYYFFSLIFFLGDIYVYKFNDIGNKYWKYCYESFKSSLFNQIFGTFPIIYFSDKYFFPTELFNIYNELLKIIIYIIIADIWFFTFHYLFHRVNFLYQNIHKYHHRLLTPSAVSALDANIFEHILVNIGSVLIGPLIYNCHIYTIRFWIIFITFNTCLVHSGFNICMNSSRHNIHHNRINYNYGQGTYIFDRLMGTYLNKRP